MQSLADVDWRRFTERRDDVPPQVKKDATKILAAVRKGGDRALRKLTARFDGADLSNPFLSASAWNALARQAPKALAAAIRANHRRITKFHQLQVGREQTVEVEPGVKLGRRPVAFESVACYVPGGRASYPSTVLMTVTPARLAGVAQVIVVTPPRADGSIDPAVAYSAKVAGAHRILRAGGAHAVAAVAYGTKTIPAVQAIVGPGNAYVTAAKQLVADRVWTDAPAGPSELLIIADASARPSHVALDLLAQAEHDPDAQVILVATSRALVEAVRQEVIARLPKTERRTIIGASLKRHGAFLVASSLDEAIHFANAYAPEHLTLMVRDARKALQVVRNAGSVFLGPHAPVSLGDYGSGTNHVLPTMGFARVRGGLSVEDFRKWVTWQEVTAAGLHRIGTDVAAVARAEGLVCHAQAVEERLQGGAA